MGAVRKIEFHLTGAGRSAYRARWPPGTRSSGRPSRNDLPLAVLARPLRAANTFARGLAVFLVRGG